jgi:tRNA (guanine37-N1)-methyltransferase
MKIDIITLFPDMFQGPFDMSMLWKAQDRGLVEINLVDLREFGLGARRTVDDTPYGGGDGMLLKPEPVFAAVEACKSKSMPPAMSGVKSQKHAPDSDRGSKVIALVASGRKYDQATAHELAEIDHLILIAGHYEGFDERIMSIVDYELSIGDYVLTGGELPAMVVVDSVVRLIPGVLGGEQSAHDESFSDASLLEYPHYTRPMEFRGMTVPEVLQNGNHAEIAAWRREQAAIKTRRNRPDLLS